MNRFPYFHSFLNDKHLDTIYVSTAFPARLLLKKLSFRWLNLYGTVYWSFLERTTYAKCYGLGDSDGGDNVLWDLNCESG